MCAKRITIVQFVRSHAQSLQHSILRGISRKKKRTTIMAHPSNHNTSKMFGSWQHQILMIRIPYVHTAVPSMGEIPSIRHCGDVSPILLFYCCICFLQKDIPMINNLRVFFFYMQNRRIECVRVCTLNDKMSKTVKFKLKYWYIFTLPFNENGKDVKDKKKRNENEEKSENKTKKT